MSEEKITHFIFFETILNTEEFIPKWQEYTSSKKMTEVILQQSVKAKGFSYIAQHCFETENFQFSFKKERRSSKTPQPEITANLAGGYSFLQIERKGEILENESKIFVLLTDSSHDLDLFRELTVLSKLNIYEAYYENCRYEYILEFFVANEYADDLLKILKQNGVGETGVYRECSLESL